MINTESRIGWYVVADNSELHEVVSVTDQLVTEAGSFPLDSLVVWPAKITAEADDLHEMGLYKGEISNGEIIYVVGLTTDSDGTEGVYFLDRTELPLSEWHLGYWWLPLSYLEL